MNGRSTATRLFLAALLIGSLTHKVNGQILPVPDRNQVTPTRDSITSTRARRDSIISPIIHAYPVFRPWNLRLVPDDQLVSWHAFDPLDQLPGQPELARLSNLGTAARTMQPARRSNIGFDAGFHAYDPYLLSADSLVMLNAPLAYTDVAYSQGPTAEDGIFAGTLARRFGKGTDFRIEALRIYNLGEYSRLANHHSSLRMGIRYVNPRGKYSLLLLHGNHIIDQEDNGGIRTDTLLGDAFFSEPINIPIYLTGAETRYRITDYQVAQTYALAGQVDRDSLGRLLVFHRLGWQNRSFKFSDPDPAVDSLYYGIFQTDQRGIRQFTSWSTLTNTAEVLGSWRSPRGSSISMQGGLEHRYHQWDNELQQERIHNLLLLGELAMRWRDRLDIRGRTQVDLGDQAGSWLAEGGIGIDIGQWAKLQAALLLSQRFPDLIEQQLTVSQRPLYQAIWAKPQQQSLSGTLRSDILHLAAGMHLGLLTNAIIYDESALPEQISETVAVNHFWVSHRLRVWKMHLDNRISYQSSNNDRIRFPEWVTRHRLYYDDLWFKKTLRTQIGLEARLISPWRPYGYQPVSGVFYLQSKEESNWFPQIDGYIALERLGFRAYFQMENIGRAIFGWTATASNGAEIPRLFSTVNGYPQPEMWMRWGVAFRFRG